MARLVLAVILIGLVLPAAALAARAGRHSGRIVATGADGRTITIEELGPWAPHHPDVVRRTFRVTSATRIEALRRSEHATWPGGFAGAPLAPSDLHRGDFVTVTAGGRRRAPVATTISVVRPGEASTPAATLGSPAAARTPARG